MVVCKCRKATKLYCFVHKVPVCGECSCSSEHQICVVRTYSEWVIDGEYDWPPTCCSCNVALNDGVDVQTTRMDCLHLMHTNCLLSYIQSFPPETLPSGYICPACSSPIWPPKSIKDTGSRLHSKLKEAISKSGLGYHLFGNHLVTLPPSEFHPPPPAFATDALAHSSTTGNKEISMGSFDSTKDLRLSSPTIKEEKYKGEAYQSLTGSSTLPLEPDIVEIEGPTTHKSPSPAGPGATTRKTASHTDRHDSEFSYYADDEDGSKNKYNRRGPLRNKFFRYLIPFWSNALPTLPVTAPPRRDGSTIDDVPEGRVRHQRSSKMDPRRILLTMAIMACMATMGILYYRLAQRNIGESITEDEPQ